MGWRENPVLGLLTLTGHTQSAVTALEKTASGTIRRCEGTIVPADATAGFAQGCEFTLSGAALGQAQYWKNIGSASSCAFVPIGPVIGWGAVTGGHGPVSLGGDATEILYDKDISAGDYALVEHGVCDDNDQICGAVVSDGAITLTLTADPTAGAKQYNYIVLREDITPTWDVFAAGERACLTADDATIAVTVTGALAGDIGMATFNATDDNDLVSDVVMTADTMTITASADPGADDTHGWDYAVFRKRGTFKPSHYIAYAGVHTTVGGDDTEVITITGALATDIAICKWNTTDDTDTFEKAVLTANTLTVVLSADPSTTHKLVYAIFREYS